MPRTSPAPAGPPPHPVFRDGQVLRAADLRAEAEANVQAGRRHPEFCHLPGVVAGLALTGSGANKVTLGPGMAVDAAGRTILVPREVAVERPAHIEPPPADVELWIAAAVTEPAPGRIAEGYELLFHTPGVHDPERPEEHPQRAVFLGSLRGADEKPDGSGRVYVGAVGARIEAPSGRARLLLGPEGPTDLRLFAFGTRGGTTGPFRDHLAAESSGAIRFADPVEVGAPERRPPEVAVVALGHRPVEFQADEVPDPAGLLVQMQQVPVVWDLVRGVATEFEAHRLHEGTGCERLGALLARLLNRLLGAAAADGAAAVAAAARAAGAALRPETVRRLLDQAGGSPRADPHPLARLLLEDAFPAHLKRLREDYDGPRGVAFAGPRPEPTAALPDRVYLAAVEDKTGPRRELRVELTHRGKENNPERYRLAVGIIGSSAAEPDRTAFEPCLTADAAGTVTIAGDLRVYASPPDGRGVPPLGLILKVKPAAGAEDPAAKAEQIGQVAPWDLVIEKPAARPNASSTALEITDGRLVNSGQARIIGVQVHAVVFAKNDPTREPVREPLLRNLVIEPGVPAALERLGGQKLEIPLLTPLTDLRTVRPLIVVLMAVGVGPGNILASSERRLEIP